MRYVSYVSGQQAGLAVRDGAELFDLGSIDLGKVLADGSDALAALAQAPRGKRLDQTGLRFRPPIARPPKIVCVGLNYVDHAAESPYKDVPSYPAVFPRFASSLIGHGEDIVRPLVSPQLDFEGELVAVIGKGGRHITREAALDHVAGYSIFNDGSIRDYQFKSPQWTVGKNFDDTGAFGPDFVTADELPPGGKGLKIETRLNGVVVQSANTNDLVFPLADLIFYLSEAITLEPGDLIITGTPAGVGFARKPQLFMKSGDICEVEIEGLGVLRNPVRDEVAVASAA
ncbi:fumarylacetoacetate hydrolase family protein [Bosea sp. 2KB_26]|uniref:fumarylacetoacetate hydrolase family protein n=1 Tax=Bosea sp. 2KB_26 TaxID=3237475 RepID=UPI003F905482